MIKVQQNDFEKQRQRDIQRYRQIAQEEKERGNYHMWREWHQAADRIEGRDGRNYDSTAHACATAVVRKLYGQGYTTIEMASYTDISQQSISRLLQGDPKTSEQTNINVATQLKPLLESEG